METGQSINDAIEKRVGTAESAAVTLYDTAIEYADGKYDDAVDLIATKQPLGNYQPAGDYLKNHEKVDLKSALLGCKGHYTGNHDYCLNFQLSKNDWEGEPFH